MPKTRALLEDRGVRFDNFFVSYSFCCPSRASILRGQYAHNTQIVGNELPYGGFEKLRERGLEQSTVATWLQAAGYHTALLGKYINRYVPETGGVPPGWSEWYAGGNAHPSYDYTLNENGRIVAYGREPEDYLNDVLTRKAVALIEAAAAPGAAVVPLRLDLYAAQPGGRAAAPQGSVRRCRAAATAGVRRGRRQRQAGGDPAPCRPSTRLRSPGSRTSTGGGCGPCRRSTTWSRRSSARSSGPASLESTYVVYTSDNGFHMGEHRLIAGKDHGLRGGHPRADDHARTGRAGGRADRGHGAQHRSRADLRRDRRHRAARLRRRPLAAAAAGRSGAALAAELPDRAPPARGALHRSGRASGPDRASSSPGTPISTACARRGGPMSSTARASASCTIWPQIPTSSTT